MTQVGMILFMSQTGGYVAACQRGATAGNRSFGVQSLDLQLNQSYADVNAILASVKETAESRDRPQSTFLRRPCDMPLPTPPQLPPTGANTVGDRCCSDDNANSTSGERHALPSLESRGMMHHRLQILPDLFAELSINRTERTENEKLASARADAAVDGNAWPHSRHHRIRATSRDPKAPGGDAFIILSTAAKTANALERQPRFSAFSVRTNVVQALRQLTLTTPSMVSPPPPQFAFTSKFGSSIPASELPELPHPEGDCFLYFANATALCPARLRRWPLRQRG